MGLYYTCPVALSAFQSYIKDSSTDATFQGVLQTFLDSATSRVYAFLRRDYSQSATKIDFFWGNNLSVKQLRFPDIASTFDAFSSIDRQGVSETLLPADLLLVPDNCALYKTGIFARNKLWKITYKTKASLACPEIVMHVIMEIAYKSFEDSRRGLGSLGKLTDFSNVLGQSALRYYDIDAQEYKRLMPYVYMGGVA